MTDRMKGSPLPLVGKSDRSAKSRDSGAVSLYFRSNESRLAPKPWMFAEKMTGSTP